MTQITISGSSPLTGQCHIPGDKSISHRAVMFASIAHGESHIQNFLDGGDCRSTIDVMRGLGVQIDEVSPTELTVHGRGIKGLQEPNSFLDCGNSGTTIRLLTGLLAGQSFTSFVTGTEQIRGRPMGRIVKPLRMMGANIAGRQDGGYAPLSITPSNLHSIEYEMPMASSQVKSCVLLAGLYSPGLTVVHQPGPTRDHTERILASMGAPVSAWGKAIHSEQPKSELTPLNITVPGDISSAAFLLVAASILPNSRMTIAGVGINSTRTGIVDALIEMGAGIEFKNQRLNSGEPVADIEVSYTGLRAGSFSGENIVTMIDELPILAVAATQAQGTTVVRDAGELRVKETDRIATTVSELRKMGAHIEAMDDGFVVDGPTTLRGAPVDSHGDHRLAMALTVAGMIAEGTTAVYGAEVTEDSFPGFETTLQVLGAELSVEE